MKRFLHGKLTNGECVIYSDHFGKGQGIYRHGGESNWLWVAVIDFTFIIIFFFSLYILCVYFVRELGDLICRLSLEFADVI